MRRKYRYYRCVGNKGVNRQLPQPCLAKSIRADVLESMVWKDVSRFVRNPGLLLQEVEAQLSQEPAVRKKGRRSWTD